MTKTINISINSEDLRAIDDYCSAHNLTRSKFIIFNTLQAIQAERIASATMQMVHVMENFSKSGKLSEADKADFERIQTLMGVIYGK